MVCLPVSRPTNSSTIARRSASRSPVLRSIRISTIIGIMISIHPERMTEMFHRNQKRATRAFGSGRARAKVFDHFIYCDTPNRRAIGVRHARPAFLLR